MKEKPALIAFKVPPNTKRRLETIAEVCGITLSELVRSTIIYRLDGVEPPFLEQIKGQKLLIWSMLKAQSIALSNLKLTEEIVKYLDDIQEEKVNEG